MSFASERILAFNAMASASMYGSTLAYKGTNYDCVADSVFVQKMMTQSAWQPDRGCEFSVLKTDWIASGMTSHSFFTYEGYTFEINEGLKLSSADSVVFFTANLKK
jgi:hypothetical protein